jgi:PAS domain S-box-containing protein
VAHAENDSTFTSPDYWSIWVRIPHSLHRLGALLTFTVAYFVAGRLGLRFAFEAPSASPVAPATGVAMAALLVLGLDLWPGVWLGALLVNATTGATLGTAAGIALGDTLEAVVAAGLVRRFGGGPDPFERPRDVLTFAAVAVGVATPLAAAVGSASLGLAGRVPAPQLGHVFVTWWVGDLAGALVVTPLLVLWARSPRVEWNAKRSLEALAILVAVVVTGGAVFDGWLPLWRRGETFAYLAAPVPLWAALRFGPRETATAVAALAVTALHGTLAGLGPFREFAPLTSLLLLQAFMATVSVTGLLLASAIAQQRRSEAEARRLNAELVMRVDADARELRAASVELSGSSERYRTLMDSAPDALLVADADGRILLANARAEETFGYGREELVGRALAEIIPQGLHARRRDGSEFPVDVRLSTVKLPTGRGVCAAVRDVSEQRRAEQALRESQAALEQAQRVAHVGSWQSGLAQDAPLEWSKETFRIFGVDPVSFGARVEDFFARVHPEDVSAVREAAGAAVARGTSYSIDHRILRPNGAVRWVHEQAEVVKDAEGRPLRLVGTVQDITDRRQLQEQLLQAQKIEAVGRLAGGVAHDFNNLLGVILGFSELARKDLPAEHRAHQRVEQIQKAAERAATLTRQLLAFSRKQLLQPRVVDLNTIAREMERMLRRLIGEDIELVTSFAPDLWPVRADPAQVEQVILNLAVNARDAMPAGGTLTIRTCEADLDPAFAGAHPGASPGPHAVLSVSDTGYGMDAATLSHVFEPFFTTKPAGHGTGLGLAMIYGIVKQSGGYISAESRPGQGTTFTVYLPRAEAQGADPVPPPEPAALPRGTETVLLVEDEASLRGVMCETLRGAGYRVLESGTAEDALAAAAAHDGAIHLLLTDVVMPGASGEALEAQLRPARPGIRVVFMSGYTDDAISRHGVLEPGRHFLQKPFAADVLLREVRRALDAP